MKIIKFFVGVGLLVTIKGVLADVSYPADIYLENKTTIPLYVKWVNLNPAKSSRPQTFCKESRAIKQFIEVLPSQSQVIHIRVEHENKFDISPCFYEMIVSKESGELSTNLIAVERFKTVYSDCGIKNSQDPSKECGLVRIVKHDTPPRLCAVGYTCKTNLRYWRNHLSLTISKW